MFRSGWQMKFSNSLYYNELGQEGLIYFNARYYDPKTGRFITEDPSAQGTGWYTYCQNNPLTYVEPTGRKPIEEYTEEDIERHQKQQRQRRERDDGDDNEEYIELPSTPPDFYNILIQERILPPIDPSQLNLGYPIESGELTSGYGPRAPILIKDTNTGKTIETPRFHRGIDLANVQGTSIISSGEGLVDTGFSETLGNWVEVFHGGGVSTKYGHLESISVKPGQWVEKGVQLGTMGKTGTLVEGAHVHFEVWFLGQRVDPSQYLPSLPASIADLR